MEQARIEHGHYVQGDFKFAVDANDAAKTFEAVAALSHDDKIKLATLNDIPTQPYIKNSLTAILKSVVQNVWLLSKGKMPPMDAHNARVARYKAEIAEASLSSGDDLLSRKRGTGRVSKARPSLKFTIDGEKFDADYQNWRGQRYLVGNKLIELNKANNNAGVTVREIFDNTKETRETPAPTRNAVGQIVNALVAAGIATCLNPQDAKKKPEPKAATPAPAAKKAAPAPTTKKKH